MQRKMKEAGKMVYSAIDLNEDFDWQLSLEYVFDSLICLNLMKGLYAIPGLQSTKLLR